MKISCSLLVLAAAALSSAQSQCLTIATKIPSCGVSCLSSAASAFGCAQTDYACQCSSSQSSSIQNAALDCIVKGCGAVTGNQVSSLAQSVCSCVATAGSGNYHVPRKLTTSRKSKTYGVTPRGSIITTISSTTIILPTTTTNAATTPEPSPPASATTSTTPSFRLIYPATDGVECVTYADQPTFSDCSNIDPDNWDQNTLYMPNGKVCQDIGIVTLLGDIVGLWCLLSSYQSCSFVYGYGSRHTVDGFYGHEVSYFFSNALATCSNLGPLVAAFSHTRNGSDFPGEVFCFVAKGYESSCWA